MFNVCWLWGEVLRAWRDTITEGQNHYSSPALGSYTGCSGMIAYGIEFFMFYHVHAWHRDCDDLTLLMNCLLIKKKNIIDELS